MHPNNRQPTTLIIAALTAAATLLLAFSVPAADAATGGVGAGGEKSGEDERAQTHKQCQRCIERAKKKCETRRAKKAKRRCIRKLRKRCAQRPACRAGKQAKQPKSVPGRRAKLRPNGKAIAPAAAPPAVKAAIDAANRIDGKRYCMGGGHGKWNDRCYDCSGAVSYVLGPKGAGLIDRPMVSGDFARWRKKGKGRWITVYGDAGHVFIVIAGLRFDTSMPDDGKSGPGWSKDIRKGFYNVKRSAARHPNRF